MGTIKDAADTTYRDHITAGVPSSGDWEPQKSEIRSLFALVETTIGQVGLAGVADVVKDTRANLNADLAHPAGTVALGYADATDANNDIYIKTGASGTGGWTLTTIIHDLIGNAAQPYLDDANAVLAAANAAVATASQMSALSQPDLTLVRKDADGSYPLPALQWWPGKFGDRVWFDGAMRDIDTVAPVRTGTQSALNGRKLATMPDLSAGVTFMVRFTRPDADLGVKHPTGCLIDLATDDTGPLSNEIGATFAAGAAGTYKALSVNYLNKRRAAGGASQTTTFFGAQRLIYSVDAAGNCRRWLEGHGIIEEGASAGYVTPTHCAIGAQLVPYNSAASGNLVDAQITEVLMYKGGMSANEIKQLIELTDPDYGLPFSDPWPNMPWTVDATGRKIYPDIWWDAAADQAWWRGRRKTMADLFITPVPYAYRLAKKAPPQLDQEGVTMFYDGAPADLFQATNKPGGVVMGMTTNNLGYGRFELDLINTPIGGFAGGAINWRGYSMDNMTSANGAQYFNMGKPVAPAVTTATGLTGTDTGRGHGVNRFIATIAANGDLRHSINAHGIVSRANAGTAARYRKDILTFGGQIGGGSPLVNFNVQCAGIFTRALTESEHKILQAQNVYNCPVMWFHGDSLRNNMTLEEAYIMRAHARGWTRYIPRVSYGFGGKGLNYHKEWIEATVAWRPELRLAQLEMFEGGLDQQSLNLTGLTLEGPWTLTQLLDMWEGVCDLFNLRPVWIQSNYNKSVSQLEANPGNVGFINEIAWVRDGNNAIKRIQPLHFVEIMPLIQTAETDNATYLDLVATDKWPDKFFPQDAGGNVVDFIHPTWPAGTDFKTSAYYYIGDAMVSHHAAIGLLPPSRAAS